MDFSLSSELLDLKNISKELADMFSKRAVEHDRDASIPFENYEALRSAGFYGMVAPKQFGGDGVGLVGYVVAAEEFSQGCAATALSFNMHVAALSSLMHSPIPDSIKQRLADLVVKEKKLFSAILSEPGTTGLLPTSYACSTQARRTDKGYILKGKKGFCSMGEASDYLVLFAHPEDDTNPESALVFLVPPKAKGIEFEHVWDTLGMRATRSDNIILDDVFVPESACIAGPLPSVGEWINANEPAFNIPYTAVYLGLGVAALSEIKKSVKRRVPLGYRQTYAHHPDIRRRIGLMSAQLESCRWLLRYSAWLADESYKLRVEGRLETSEGQALTKEVLSNYLKAKYVVGETVTMVSRSALEMGGAHALFKSATLERLFRDSATASIQHPGSDLCLSELSIHELGINKKELRAPLNEDWGSQG